MRRPSDTSTSRSVRLGEQVSGDDRNQVAVTRRELQAIRADILAVFQPMIQAGLIDGSS